MSINVAAGATLTFLAQPAFQRRRLFTGPGAVRFSGAGGTTRFLVFPEWWGDALSGAGMSAALEGLRASCAAARCTIVWTCPWVETLAQPLALAPNLEFWSAPAPGIRGPGTGFSFQPGQYYANRPYVLPSLGDFPTAIEMDTTKGLRV